MESESITIDDTAAAAAAACERADVFRLVRLPRGCPPPPPPAAALAAALLATSAT